MKKKPTIMESYPVIVAVLFVGVFAFIAYVFSDTNIKRAALRKMATPDYYATSVATYPAFYTAEFGGATLTHTPMEKAKMMATNRALLAPTCPGIADLAGNCMEQFTYNFTVPMCTPVACDGGVYVCPESGDGCPGGCGIVCEMPGKPFGPFDYAPDANHEQHPFTLTRTNYKVSNLENVRAHNMKAFVAVTGSKSNYYTNDCFDIAKWKSVFDSRIGGLQPFVDDGTIIGLYAVDEPDDDACGPTYEELNEVCRYAHEKLPGIPCGFNTEAAYLAQGRDKIPEIDFIFDQTNFSKVKNWGGWAEWANAQFVDAWWFDGPIYLSINAYTYSPTEKQINDAAIELCNSDAAGVMMWKWDYLKDMDFSPAIAACSGQVVSIPTITPQPATPTVTPTETPIPTLNTCVKVVWDSGLKLRWGPSMGGSPTSFLDEGFVFVPLGLIDVDGYGPAVKVVEPDWYIFMTLEYRPNDTYAVFVECP